jgi:hypothetical protein
MLKKMRQNTNCHVSIDAYITDEFAILFTFISTNFNVLYMLCYSCKYIQL